MVKFNLFSSGVRHLQTFVDRRLLILKLVIAFPFSLPRANRKQLKVSATQANWSDKQVKQSGN